MCGGWSNAEEHSDTHKEIFQFALNEITAEGSEHKHPTFDAQHIVEVRDLSQQVVSGMNYKFTLVLASRVLTDEEKSDESIEKKLCTITVYDQPWTNTRQISKLQWTD